MEPVEGSEVEESRRLFRDLLRLIADPERQLGYERDVPIANVPAELVSMWFDDHYHPDEAWFEEIFSSDERDVLARFSDRYEQRVPGLPSQRGVESLHASPQWTEVVFEAKAALETLGWDSTP